MPKLKYRDRLARALRWLARKIEPPMFSNCTVSPTYYLEPGDYIMNCSVTIPPNTTIIGR